ncbi:hypothetical protein BVRB_5g107130 [Beta vulgaris subsp. vulgaris]|nr:hypothetical protein BVRB_5g107130 [Beta vulgaris subsp. vulgaris]
MHNRNYYVFTDYTQLNRIEGYFTNYNNKKIVLRPD